MMPRPGRRSALGGGGRRPPRSRLLARATFFAVLSTACAVALLATSGWLITRAAEQPPVLYLLVAVVSVRALGVFRGVFRYLERLDGHQAALERQVELRLDTWQRLLARSWVGRRSGELLSRIVTDVETVHDGVVRVFLPLTAACVVTVAALGLLALVLPSVAVWVLACTIVSGVVLPWAGARLSVRHQRILADAQGRLSSLVAESAETASDLLVYGAVHRRAAQVDALNAELRGAELQLSSIQAVVQLGQVVANGAALIGALLLGVEALAAGRISGPLLTVLVLVPLALQEVVAVVPDALLFRTRTTAARQRVVNLGTPADLLRDTGGQVANDVRGPGRDRTAAPAVVVRAVDLGVGHTASPVTDGISFVAGPGDRIGITGRSGAGKSTLAATLLGLLPPRTGRLEMQGSVGYLDQEAHLFDTTVAENVRIGRADADRAAVQEALRRAGFQVDPDRLVGEHGRQVSGGEARRIALARLLVRDDDIVVLDEPTEHLDEATAAALRRTLIEVTASRATIIISHDPQLLETCTAVIHLTAAVSTPTTAAPQPGRC